MIAEASSPAMTRSVRLPVYAMLGANAVSLVGNVLTGMAIPWFVLVTTGSAAKTGLVGFFTILPSVIAAFFGGGLVDRVGPKRMSVVADVMSGLTVAMVPLLYHTVGLAFWQLLVLVFLGALLDAPGGTARVALFPDVVERAGMHLERANAAYQTIQRLSQLLGPPLAGVLIATLGASNVLWLDAASFAVSAMLIALAIPATKISTEARGRYLDEIREGLRFLWQDRLVRAVVLTVAVTNLLDAALGGVIWPVYAKEIFGRPQALGLMYAGFGAGAVLSSVAFGAIGHRLPRRATFVGSFVVVALPYWLLATTPSLPWAVAAFFVEGLAVGPLNPIIMTVAQERIPSELRGRVFGAAGAMAMAAAPLGVITAGVLVEWLGLPVIIAIIATCYLAATASMIVNPAIREMDHGNE
jgi:MFS family permease